MEESLKKEIIGELEHYLEFIIPDLKQGYKNTATYYSKLWEETEKNSISDDRLFRDCYAEIEYARESLEDIPKVKARILRLIHKVKNAE